MDKTDREAAIYAELVAAVEAVGLDLVLKNGATGHYHIIGPILVNYYPFSPNRTAYAKGTTKGKPCTPAEAVALSIHGPDIAPEHLKGKRDRNTRQIRMGLLGPSGLGKCCWCGKPIDIETSSIEHRIPLSRGGLEHQSNRMLACRPCNEARAGGMPELQGDLPWVT